MASPRTRPPCARWRRNSGSASRWTDSTRVDALPYGMSVGRERHDPGKRHVLPVLPDGVAQPLRGHDANEAAMLLVALEVFISQADDILPVHEGVESHRRAREVHPHV